MHTFLAKQNHTHSLRTVLWEEMANDVIDLKAAKNLIDICVISGLIHLAFVMCNLDFF